MNYEDALSTLNKSWELSGFFGQLRNGVYLSSEAEEVLQALEYISRLGEEKVSFFPAIVRLTWFIPVFSSWQQVRLKQETDVAKLQKFINEVIELLYIVLGTP